MHACNAVIKQIMTDPLPIRRRSIVPSAKRGYAELEDGSKHRVDMVYMDGQCWCMLPAAFLCHHDDDLVETNT